MMKHAQTIKHTMDVVNLDPAAEHFDYSPILDIRDLIKVDDVMEDEDLKLGPNGGLIFCMEYISPFHFNYKKMLTNHYFRYMVKNTEWLEEALGDGVDDDYLLFDCPGQIELYTHMTVFHELVELLQK